MRLITSIWAEDKVCEEAQQRLHPGRWRLYGAGKCIKALLTVETDVGWIEAVYMKGNAEAVGGWKEAVQRKDYVEVGGGWIKAV